MFTDHQWVKPGHRRIAAWLYHVCRLVFDVSEAAARKRKSESVNATAEVEQTSTDKTEDLMTSSQHTFPSYDVTSGESISSASPDSNYKQPVFHFLTAQCKRSFIFTCVGRYYDHESLFVCLLVGWLVRSIVHWFVTLVIISPKLQVRFFVKLDTNVESACQMTLLPFERSRSRSPIKVKTAVLIIFKW